MVKSYIVSWLTEVDNQAVYRSSQEYGYMKDEANKFRDYLASQGERLQFWQIWAHDAKVMYDSSASRVKIRHFSLFWPRDAKIMCDFSASRKRIRVSKTINRYKREKRENEDCIYNTGV